MNNIVILIAIIIVTTVIYYSIQKKKWKNKIERINSNRPKITREEYINRLEKKGFNKKHIEIVHDEIYKFIDLENFSMYPEDCIYSIYRIEDLDDVELIDQICRKSNIRKPEQKDFDNLADQYPTTTAESILVLMRNLEGEISD
jgi:hypothetical protein